MESRYCNTGRIPSDYFFKFSPQQAKQEFIIYGKDYPRGGSPSGSPRSFLDLISYLRPFTGEM